MPARRPLSRPPTSHGISAGSTAPVRLQMLASTAPVTAHGLYAAALAAFFVPPRRTPLEHAEVAQREIEASWIACVEPAKGARDLFGGRPGQRGAFGETEVPRKL